MFHLISFSPHFIVNVLSHFLQFTLHYVSYHFLQSTLHCSCFIWFLSVHTSLIMFHFYFLQSTFYLIYFIYHSPSHSYLPYLVTLILHGHSTLLSVSHFSQSPLWKLTSYKCLQINFQLDGCSLLEAELWWFYYSLPLCIKQETQQVVQFDVRMRPDPPVSSSWSQVPLKFLMTNHFFSGLNKILKKGGVIGNN